MPLILLHDFYVALWFQSPDHDAIGSAAGALEQINSRLPMRSLCGATCANTLTEPSAHSGTLNFPLRTAFEMLQSAQRSDFT